LHAVAIVNPAAGSGKAARVWPLLLGGLRGGPDVLTTWWTNGPGHGEILAARARRQGYERILAVGGDGTVFEVANGMWWEPRGRLPSLGIVPLGTGCDYVRNFSQGHTLGDYFNQALGETTMAVRVGIVQFQTMDGKPLTRIFLNILGVGFDAQVVTRMRRQKLSLAGKTPYLISGLQELLLLRHFRLTGLVDDEPVASRSAILVAALGRTFGGGIMIAPFASPQSGRLQVVWGEGLGRLTLLSLLGKTFTGDHLSHPRVHSRFAGRLHLSADPPALVQVEGEPLGRTPLAVVLSPEKLHVAVS
jgi:diacylglycerol kinase (ATP)